MLNRAPNVYTPVEPEDDGVVLPAVLSFLVHSAILAFIIFFHRAPKIETPEPIETTIITPEELLDLQSEIISNRQAQIENVDSNDIELDENDSKAALNNKPIETKKYSDTRSTQTRSISSILTSDNNSIEPVDISEPDQNSSTEDFPQDTDPFDLNDANDPNTVNDSNSDDNRVNEDFEPSANNVENKGNAKSEKQIKNELENLIYPNWFPPKNKVGLTIEATISYDSATNNISISTNSNDVALEKSLVQAINNANIEKTMKENNLNKAIIEFKVL